MFQGFSYFYTSLLPTVNELCSTYASCHSLQRIQRYSLMDMVIHGKTKNWWTNGQSSYQIFSLGKYKIVLFIVGVYCHCFLYVRMCVRPYIPYVRTWEACLFFYFWLD